MSNSSALSADRVLAVLEMLVRMSEGVSLSRIAQELDLPLSATHRLLTVLVNRNYARQNPATEQYEPTLAIATLGIRLLANTRLSDVYQPILDELAEETGELVRLAVLDGEKLTWIARAQGATSSIRYDPVSGHDVPLHATAMGKAWLATLPEQEALRVATAAGFTGAAGPNAVASAAELAAHLREARERGYGLVNEEAEPGISAIAMVVRDGSTDAPVGCISIGGPSFRLSEAKLESFVPKLRAAVDELSALWPVRTYQARNLQERSFPSSPR
ncbi:IclR family transcriptional regulator [Dongia deserti]|uniref:IclR family transcriptional regulator n=1 Tax=Dongia deserti TaxID=2268030 RepID=UPI0013C3F79D|nr:IclR family transcriptional regulator [Dongia deserti]